jgi:hypothetical protein
MLRAFTAGIVALVVAAVIVIADADTHVTSAASQIEPAMTGAWTGDARIAVNWTNARTLHVAVTIEADGTAAGTIGDATLRNGRLEPNRTTIGRALHIKTDWIIKGSLDGDVIKAEGIRRDGVMIPMNFVGGRFEGGVNTSGSHFGGKDSMWLAAQGLVLERVEIR